jgi:hypothetical protein
LKIPDTPVSPTTFVPGSRAIVSPAAFTISTRGAVAQAPTT